MILIRMLGGSALPDDGFDFGEEIDARPAWQEITRLADALEHAVGLKFRNAPIFPPNASDQQLAQLVQRLDTDGYDALWDWRRQWRMNEEFDRGNYSAFWNDVTRVVDFDAVGPRVHAPIFRPTLAVLEARLNSTKPEFVIAARSTDQATVDKARAATRAVKAECQNIGVDEARTEVVHKLLLKGSVFGELVWDAKGGQYLGKTKIPLRDENDDIVPKMVPDDDPMSVTFGEMVVARDEEGMPEWEVEVDEFGDPVELDAFEGCNVFSVIDPEDIVPDPTITRWRDRRWLIHRWYEAPASIEDKFGFVGIKPDDREQSDAPPSGMGQRPGRKSRRSDSRTALVRKLIISRGTFPCSDEPDDNISFPEGWIIIECQGQVKAMPNQYGDGPIWFRKALVGDQQLHGECIANDLRGLQATFTNDLSNWSFQNAVTGNPRLFWPAGAGTPDEEKWGTPGAIINREGMSDRDRPFLADGKTIARGAENFVHFVFGDLLGYISGVREGGLAGGAPPGDPNAAAYRLLAEADNSRLATTVLNYGLFLQDLSKQIIHNIKTFASEPRLYTLIGPDMSVETEEFAGSDVSDEFTHFIVPASIEPQSREIRRAAALELFSSGVLSRRDLTMRIGETEGEDATLEMRLLQQCRREAKQALDQHAITTPLQLMQFEDHQLAIDAHRADMFDQRFQDDPIAMAAMIIHCQIHTWLMGGMMGPPPLGMSLIPGIPPVGLPGAMPAQPGTGQPPPPGQPDQSAQPTQPGESGMETGGPPFQ